MNISIQSGNGTPAYRQIIRQVMTMIRDGAYGPGDKLPTERELAARLKVARGTVKRAYDALVRDQVIEVRIGRGTFVSSQQDVLAGGRKERAIRAVEQVIDELEGLRFSSREIRALVDLKLSEREERLSRFHAAAVACSPEALDIFARQLERFYGIRLSRIRLEELREAEAPVERMAAFDLIVVSAVHADELRALLPGLEERLFRVAVSPSQETIIEIAGLSPTHRMGVICHSEVFRSIVHRKLTDLNLLSGSGLPFLSIRDEADLPTFLERLDVVFVPPGYEICRNRKTVYAVQAFAQRGGRVIVFDYQIERGSLLQMEERIRQILNR